jgi:hypothetical protein
MVIPNRIAKENPLILEPPNKNKTITTNKVVNEVNVVLLKVLLMALLITSCLDLLI